MIKEIDSVSFYDQILVKPEIKTVYKVDMQKEFVLEWTINMKHLTEHFLTVNQNKIHHLFTFNMTFATEKINPILGKI